jgi:hypothetical protein
LWCSDCNVTTDLFGAFFINIEIPTNGLTSTSQKIRNQPLITRARLLLSNKPKVVDDINVERQLVPTPLSASLPLDALSRQVGKDRLGHHMVAKLLWHVGQHWIFDEGIIGEREMLESYHGNEQLRETFQKKIPVIEPPQK